jgi:hypothetical protein
VRWRTCSREKWLFVISPSLILSCLENTETGNHDDEEELLREESKDVVNGAVVRDRNEQGGGTKEDGDGSRTESKGLGQHGE